jgi:hypothetical protein
MWIVIARAPQPSAHVWPGRIPLAVIDALVWPFLWGLAIHRLQTPSGIVGPVVFSIAALFATVRLGRAVWANERYWFTTWRWGKVVAALLLMGWVLKLAVAA